eukprot:CAMPEP_0176097120 /NCGR_PEP_ID=MMETSP0120_2-20121206/48688_1 /TAXON_ID=160619 /ORGANISM="Kryptoperidinium foliaceum, Strain CCMP 1326" /LENGTH=459 /DNA_ID=CAMNT_0017431109 /DNA_START=1 /DNA_END=1381 /DNA_ORIENTATION=-
MATMNREKQVEALVTLARSRGAASLNALQKKIDAGEPLNVKGNTIGTDVLQEVVALLSKDPAFAAAAATSAGGAVPTPARSEAAAPPINTAPAQPAGTGADAAALAAKAVSEYENAKPFNRVVRVVGGAKVALLAKPDVLSQPTGEYLQDGQTAETVARLLSPRDGRVYMRMKGQNGWLSTRSRKCFAKTVLAPASGDPLEPPEYADAGPCGAVDLLQAVDGEGREVQLEGAAGSPPGKRAPCAFRTLISRHPVLSAPSIAVAVNSTIFLNPQDKVEVDAVHYNPAEHRAYLRLRDGRGWVCDRTKGSLHRVAMEPVDAPAAGGADDGAKRLKTEDGRVLIMRSGSAEAKAAEQPPVAQKGAEQPAVFRSDEEMWPVALRPPKPILPAVRQRMRRLFIFHSRRITEAEQDLKEASEQADTYSRSCPAVQELRQYMDSVKREIATYQKEWAGAVTRLLGE